MVTLDVYIPCRLWLGMSNLMKFRKNHLCFTQLELVVPTCILYSLCCLLQPAQGHASAPCNLHCHTDADLPQSSHFLAPPTHSLSVIVITVYVRVHVIGWQTDVVW